MAKEDVEEVQEEVKEETQEDTMEESQEEAPANEEEALEKELEEDEEKLPFANARVVRLLKEGMDSDKMVRARVKKEMNEWLGSMVNRVAKDMNKSPYTMIEAGDLHRAIKKYEQLEEVARQKERMLVYLDRIKQDCNMMIGEIERSFDIGEGPKVMNAEREKEEESEEEQENA